ncbi:MAG: hypothetical protein ACYTF9_15265 [Planctomycetota bacterium]|jgi:hypothetical protein
MGSRMHVTARSLMLGLGVCLVASLAACESTQTVETSTETTPVATGPETEPETAPATEPASGEAADMDSDPYRDRANPFSEERVEKLENGLKPLEAVPVDTGLSAHGSQETSVAGTY